MENFSSSIVRAAYNALIPFGVKEVVREWNILCNAFKRDDLFIHRNTATLFENCTPSKLDFIANKVNASGYNKDDKYFTSYTDKNGYTAIVSFNTLKEHKTYSLFADLFPEFFKSYKKDGKDGLNNISKQSESSDYLSDFNKYMKVFEKYMDLI